MTSKAEEQQAPKAPAKKASEKKYTHLSAGDRIDRCGWILPNRLQCWQAGKERVSYTDESGNDVEIQYCERHARIQKAIDAGTLKLETIDTPLKEFLVEPPYTEEPVQEETGEKTEGEKAVESRQETGALPPEKEGESKTPTKTQTESKEKDQGYFYKK